VNSEIIAVGTEILLGQIINSNSAYLSRKLAELGIDVYYHSTVGDNPNRLSQMLSMAISRSDIIFTTGGLGPTVDDITLKTVAQACSKRLLPNKNIIRDIQSYFKKKGLRRTPADAVRQASIPRDAAWFRNTVGTAPGLALKHRNSLIIMLPGPPRELNPMFENYVIPYLKRRKYAESRTLVTRTIRTTGLVESAVNKKMKKFLSISGLVTVGIYAHLGEVHLKISAKAKNPKAAERLIAPIERKIRKILGHYIYGTDKDELEDVIGRLLQKKRKTLSIAESCTGGMVSDKITDVSGSSAYFKMGVISYSNKAKEDLLSVSKETLKRYGAVSRPVALEMAKGVMRLSSSDVSVGITGIAGPTGGSRKKPVGLVYIAIARGKKAKVKECRFTGNRKDIKQQTQIAALDLIRRELYR